MARSGMYDKSRGFGENDEVVILKKNIKMNVFRLGRLGTGRWDKNPDLVPTPDLMRR
jgi:hypothetical protein